MVEIQLELSLDDTVQRLLEKPEGDHPTHPCALYSPKTITLAASELCVLPCLQVRHEDRRWLLAYLNPMPGADLDLRNQFAEVRDGVLTSVLDKMILQLR